MGLSAAGRVGPARTTFDHFWSSELEKSACEKGATSLYRMVVGVSVSTEQRQAQKLDLVPC
ncbi:hypothetical protein BCEN4_740108 [Burkholderia cenocepacia]|nr:hypothetical protein BCEN4_740108 [Burkholderia cenocepacia]